MLNTDNCAELATILRDAARDSGEFAEAYIKLDLHPTEGYLISTDKLLILCDKNGNEFTILIQATPRRA